MDNNLCVFLLFHCRSWKLPSTFVSVSFSDPCWMNTRLFLVAGADGRDWICVTGESAQLLPVAAACQTAAVCLSLAQTHTHSLSLAHKQSVTHPVTLIQKHKCIHSHTAIHPKQSALLRCPAKGAHAPALFLQLLFFMELRRNTYYSLYLYSVHF